MQKLASKLAVTKSRRRRKHRGRRSSGSSRNLRVDIVQKPAPTRDGGKSRRPE
jgi:hypothetical protein